jgi:hypothetical protein
MQGTPVHVRRRADAGTTPPEKEIARHRATDEKMHEKVKAWDGPEITNASLLKRVWRQHCRHLAANADVLTELIVADILVETVHVLANIEEKAANAVARRTASTEAAGRSTSRTSSKKAVTFFDRPKQSRDSLERISDALMRWRAVSAKLQSVVSAVFRKWREATEQHRYYLLHASRLCAAQCGPMCCVVC